jgi:hypothetical protein
MTTMVATGFDHLVLLILTPTSAPRRLGSSAGSGGDRRRSRYELTRAASRARSYRQNGHDGIEIVRVEFLVQGFEHSPDITHDTLLQRQGHIGADDMACTLSPTCSPLNIEGTLLVSSWPHSTKADFELTPSLP